MPKPIFLPQDVRDKLAAESLSRGRQFEDTSIAGLVYLDQDVLDKLEELRQGKNISMLEVIRRLLD